MRNNSMKSSEEARALIRAIRRTGKKRRRSFRLVAHMLRLPNPAQVQKILEGEIRDTLAMKAALRRADERAERAWANVNAAPADVVDAAALRTAIAELERTLKYLKFLVQEQANK